MQRIGDRLGLGLSDLAARVRIELMPFTLDGVELSEVLERLLGELAVVVCVQIEELAPRVRQAAAFEHALGQQCLVARIVIAHELATPCSEEGLRMLA